MEKEWKQVPELGSIARRGKAIVAQPRERPQLSKCLTLGICAHVLADWSPAVVMTKLNGAQPPSVRSPPVERPLSVRALASHRGSQQSLNAQQSLKSLLKYDEFRR